VTEAIPSLLPALGRCFAVCSKSADRAVNTCMPYSEIRFLRWRQVDFAARSVTVGKSKSDFGTGRVIPPNGRASAILDFWASNLPNRKPIHYGFPYERYGAPSDNFKPCA